MCRTFIRQRNFSPSTNLFLRRKTMTNRRFEMHQYRQIIYRLRLVDSSRSIARAGLAGRKKIQSL